MVYDMFKTEEVLVISERHLQLESGFDKDPERVAYVIGQMEKAFHLERDLAEVNEKNKQLIPYIIFRHKDKIFTYLRAPKSGETRLHNKWSIGIGGHVDLDDGRDPVEAFNNAVKREVEEELSLTKEMDVKVNPWILGTLYDSSDSVGRVHLGIVISMMIEENELPEIKTEDTIQEYKWLTLEEVKQLEGLENWSKMIIDSL